MQFKLCTNVTMVINFECHSYRRINWKQNNISLFFPSSILVGSCMRSRTIVAACTLWKEETTAHLWIGKLRIPTSSLSAGWLTIFKLLHPKTASLTKENQCFKVYLPQIIKSNEPELWFTLLNHTAMCFYLYGISMMNQLFEKKMQLAQKYSCTFYFVFVLRHWVEIKVNCEEVAVLSLSLSVRFPNIHWHVIKNTPFCQRKHSQLPLNIYNQIYLKHMV